MQTKKSEPLFWVLDAAGPVGSSVSCAVHDGAEQGTVSSGLPVRVTEPAQAAG